MKRSFLTVLICGVILAVSIIFNANSQETKTTSRESGYPVIEYASVRFMEEKTSIVWPDGTVENVMASSSQQKFQSGERYPKGSDYRIYWLIVAMNIMGKKGFEFVHMDGPDVIMKRVMPGK